MIPQIYTESESLKLSKDEIKEIKKYNDLKNKEIFDKTEKDSTNFKCDDVEYTINKIANLHLLKKGIQYSLTDMPGINDARTKNQYEEYIKNNFHKYDIIIFLIDTTQPSGTTDVRNTLELIMKQISDYKKLGYEKHMITLANKIDDLDFQDNKPIIEDEEIKELYDDIKNLIFEYAQKYDISELCQYVLPISSEEIYIYRTIYHNESPELEMKYIDKLGINEYGKSKWKKIKNSGQEYDNLLEKISESVDETYESRMMSSGFDNFNNVLKELLNEKNQFCILQDKIGMYLKEYFKPFIHTTIDENLKIFTTLHQQENIIMKLYNKAEIWKTHQNMIQYLNLYLQQMEILVKTNTNMEIINHSVEIIDKILEIYKTFNNEKEENYIKIVLEICKKVITILLENKCNIIINNFNTLTDISDSINILFDNGKSIDSILELLEKRYNSNIMFINTNLIDIYKYISNSMTDKTKLIPIVLDILNKYLYNSLEGISQKYKSCYYAREMIYYKIKDREKAIKIKYILDIYLYKNSSYATFESDIISNPCDENCRSNIVDSLINFYAEIYNEKLKIIEGCDIFDDKIISDKIQTSSDNSSNESLNIVKQKKYKTSSNSEEDDSIKKVVKINKNKTIKVVK